VIEIDFKTGHVTMKIPAKFPPGGWSAIKALGSAINTWYSAKEVRGLEELHTQAEGLLVSSAKASRSGSSSDGLRVTSVAVRVS
jgi:hypothetical protein